VWSWDITYLPTTVRGIWLYLYLVIDVWSHKVVAWDVGEREDPAIAADLVSRACLRERISKGRRQPLILHADNGNAMRAATLESRLEELGVLRSFSRPRVSNVTRTRKHCSGKPNSNLTTRIGPSPAR
jgi:transposase InsO family protein